MIAATDGACNKHGCGWAYTIRVPAARRDTDLPVPFLVWECSEKLSDGETAQRAEVRGLIECLDFLLQLSPVVPVEIKCDSKYILSTLVDGGTGPLTFPPTGWMKKWIAAGWTKEKGDAPSHLDQWKRCYDIIQRLVLKKVKITLRWIPGHSGDADNTRADILAVKASQGQVV